MEDQYKDAERIKCCGQYPDPVQAGTEELYFNRCKVCKLRTDPMPTSLSASYEWNKAITTQAFRIGMISRYVKQYVLTLYMQDGMTMKEIGTYFNTNRFKVSGVLSTFKAFRDRESERNREYDHEVMEGRLID